MIWKDRKTPRSEDKSGQNLNIGVSRSSEFGMRQSSDPP